jgi:hypothetical protein
MNNIDLTSHVFMKKCNKCIRDVQSGRYANENNSGKSNRVRQTSTVKKENTRKD